MESGLPLLLYKVGFLIPDKFVVQTRSYLSKRLLSQPQIHRCRLVTSSLPRLNPLMSGQQQADLDILVMLGQYQLITATHLLEI